MTKKNGYLHKKSAELDEAKRARDALNKPLADAHAELSNAKQVTEEIRNRSDLAARTDADDRAFQREDAAANHIRELTYQARDLDADIRRLQDIVNAPIELAQAAERIADLHGQIEARKVDAAAAEQQDAKLLERIAAIKSDSEAQLQAASEALAAGGEGGEVPESTLRAEVEQRVLEKARVSLAQTCKRIAGEISDLEGQLLDAQHVFRQRQAAVAENALQEVIRNHIEAFARASAARFAAFEWTRKVDEYTVTIPREEIDAARARLAAEMPVQDWAPHGA